MTCELFHRNAQISDNAEILSDGRPMCLKRDEDRTDLNEAIRNSQADRDKARLQQRIVGRPALVSR